MIKHNPIPLIVILVTGALLLLLSACGGDSDGGDGVAFGLRSELVTPAERVSEIVFAPDGRIFFAEQFTGNIRIIQADGTLQEAPFAALDVADYINLDWGLTGLALDPGFEMNGYVYAFYSKPDIRTDPPTGPTAHPAVVRFTDSNGIGTDETIVTEDFPETPVDHPGYNANGKMHFGPDGMLYLSVGDYDDHENPSNPPQDLSTPIGKLLRINPADGSAPADNPFVNDPAADPRVFAYGFRDPFAFAFHPETGVIYGADNTTVSCEELNIIEPGGNYGWVWGEFSYSDCTIADQGRVIHYFTRDGLQQGDFLSLVEVSAMDFSTASRYPELGAALVACESWRSQTDEDGNVRDGTLRRLVLGGAALDAVTSSDQVLKGCRGTVSVGPDGTIYYANDTEIRRLEIGEGDGGGGDDGGADDGGDATGDGDGAPTQPVPPAATP